MNVEIVKFDNLGRGIGYIEDKIIFIPKTVPGDIVKVEITKTKKSFFEGEILEIIKPSKKRIAFKCPYFATCGGCDLMHISISEALEYKLEKVNEILHKNNIDYLVEDIIKSDSYYNYRNKITLKIVNKKIGYFKNNTHDLIEIDKCLICNDNINNLMKELYVLGITNGEIIIRVNYNGEIILIIDSLDEIDNIDYLVDNYKIVGIIKNNKCIYGDDFFIDKINDYIFKVSYDAFFQVNPYVCSKLFLLVEEYSLGSKNILDLYCGVGTFSIVGAKNAREILGVEINENAIISANLNKNLNNCQNVLFMCDDTANIIDKINKDVDTIILDPPRNGVMKEIINKIIVENIEKIIYISCNPITLVRDIKLLENYYEIKEFKLLDMFPNCEHVESFVVLDLKK